MVATAYSQGNTMYSYGHIQLPIKKDDIIKTDAKFAGVVKLYPKRFI